MAKKLSGLNDPIMVFGVVVKDGEKDLIGGKLLATILAQSRSSDPVRAMAVAQKIYDADGTVILDDSDMDMLRKALAASQNHTNLVLAPLSTLIESAAEVKI